MLRTILMAAGLLLGLAAPRPAPAAEPELRKVVMLMRHGVRPQSDVREIAPYAASPWAGWSVPDGELTIHGKQAVEQLARWQRRSLAARGLLTAEGCPRPDDVFVWANSDRRRTVDTADAMLATMYPGCGLQSGHLALRTPDPLFMASESQLGALDPAIARAAILERMGGSFDRPKQQLAPLLAELGAVLQCCAKPVCPAEAASCGFADLPWSFQPTYHGNSLAVSGPMWTGATIAQVLLLQYAEGFPPEQLAWGRAPSAADIIRLSEIRKIKYEYFERVPYVARRGASNILRQIAIALETGAGLPSPDNAEGPPAARYTLFVGSDTQIAEIGALLDAHWQLPTFLDDETPPEGALVFELLQDGAGGSQYVRLLFQTPSLEQLRAASAFTDASPPIRSVIKVPGCKGALPDGACPAAEFTALLRANIDPTATARPPYAR